MKICTYCSKKNYPNSFSEEIDKKIELLAKEYNQSKQMIIMIMKEISLKRSCATLFSYLELSFMRSGPAEEIREEIDFLLKHISEKSASSCKCEVHECK